MQQDQVVLNQENHAMMTDVREAWFFLRRNAKLVGMITAGIVALSIVLALVLPGRYVGETVIMLDPRKTNVTNIESVMSSIPSENSSVVSEMDIIRSRAVINRVIDQLGMLNDPSFNSSLSGTRWFFRLFASRDSRDTERRASEDRGAIAANLLAHLDVSNDGRSYSIVIRYYDHDPIRAAQIANAFADQYLADQLEVKYDVSRRVNEWLTRRLDELQAKVKVTEKAVEDYKTANNLVDVGEETLTQEQISNIDEHLLEAEAERSMSLARLSSVKALSGAQLETSSIVIASPLIQQLKQQEAEVRRKVADLSTRYGDRHPVMIDARNELASIHEKIGEEIAKIIAGLQNDVDISNSKVDSMQKQLTKLKVEAGSGNQAMVTLRELEREATSNRSLYEGFMNRSKQISEQQDLQIADSRIIARAETPIKPYFPNVFVFIDVGMILGIAIGILVSLLLEYLDRGIRSLSVAERLYGVSGLGIVPVAEVVKGQLPTDYVLEKPLSVYAESIRSIRAAIHFSNVDNPPKVIVVTSSFPNEGKTVFSISFTRLMARSGQKVIIIDADMRRPRVHSVLSLDKTKPDLAMLLAGDATLEQTIQKDASGADVIIARAKTANPQDLLSSHQMEKLLIELRKKYDMIVIDTPPIIAITDAALIGQRADTTIYIARWSSTAHEVIGEGLRKLAKFNIKVAGLVLTQVDLRDRKQYGYDDYSHYYGQYESYYSN